MSGPTSSIDGLVSGLNTTDIINSLMQLASQPQTDLKSRVSTANSVLSAYQSVNTRMSALQSAADLLYATSTWQSMSATSSSTGVAASAAGGAQAGTFSFDVTQLAKGQSSVSSGTVSSTAAIVTTTGTPVTVTTSDGTVVTIDTGSGSLADVIAGFNANADAGVKAAAVQVSSGVYRLQLTSATSGAAASFTVAGLDALGTMANTSTAQDAQITVGAGSPGEYTVGSTTNTFAGVLPGVSFTVSKVESGVTLTVASDAGAIADKVQAMVDAANAALDEISKQTAFDPSRGVASPLMSDFTVRQLQQNILSAVSSGLPDGTSAATVGIELTKDGHLTFTRQTFIDAYDADPVKTQNAFAASGAFTPSTTLHGSVSLTKSTDATRPGSYDVVVTRAATQASATLDTTGGIVAGQQITLSVGDTTKAYTVQAGDTAQTLVDQLNSLSASGKLGLVVTTDGSGVLSVKTQGYGAVPTFSISATGGLVASSVTAGTDVAGTINGQEASGSGQLLFTTAGAPGVDAITLKVTLDSADVTALAGGSAGSLSYRAGVGQALASVGWRATDSVSGALTAAIKGQTSTIDDLNGQISNWDVLLAQKKAALQQQYANLEVMLGQMQSQSQWLAGQIASLPQISNTAKSSSG